jgi:hypothetical protein
MFDSFAGPLARAAIDDRTRKAKSTPVAASRPTERPQASRTDVWPSPGATTGSSDDHGKLIH